MRRHPVYNWIVTHMGLVVCLRCFASTGEAGWRGFVKRHKAEGGCPRREWRPRKAAKEEGVRIQFPDFVPKARGLADTITPKQQGFITALAREAGVDAKELARTHYGCDLEECSKDGASRLIEHLKDGKPLPVVTGGVLKGAVGEVGADGVIRPVDEEV